MAPTLTVDDERPATGDRTARAWISPCASRSVVVRTSTHVRSGPWSVAFSPQASDPVRSCAAEGVGGAGEAREQATANAITSNHASLVCTGRRRPT